MTERFTILQDFYSEDFKSHYVKDMSYTVQSERLREHVSQWVKEGKARFGGPEPKVVGTGSVS